MHEPDPLPWAPGVAPGSRPLSLSPEPDPLPWAPRGEGKRLEWMEPLRLSRGHWAFRTVLCSWPLDFSAGAMAKFQARPAAAQSERTSSGRGQPAERVAAPEWQLPSGLGRMTAADFEEFCSQPAWTRESVLAMVQAAAEHGGENAGMLNLWWQQAMARPLVLVGAFLGDVDESPPIGGWFAPQLGPADYMRFLEPPPCVGWFDFLNSALYQRMLNEAELYCF